MPDRPTCVKPIVSLIIATRNRAHCLPRALNSVFAQEGLGEDFALDVIVVDDASSDATPEVIGHYPAVGHVRTTESRGVAAARNVALRLIRGAYVAFLDDDDEWFPHKLRIQVPVLQANPDVGLVYSQFQMRFGDREWLWPPADRARSGWVFDDLLNGNFMGSMLIRREALDKAGDFDESLRTHSDYDLWLRLAFHVQFLFVPGAVATYTPSPKGLWLSLGDLGDGVRAVQKALEMLPDCREFAALKREAIARATLGTLTSFIYVRDAERIWPRLSQIFRRHPWIAPYPWAQGYLSSAIELSAAASPSPLTRVRDICAQLRLGLREAGEKDPRRARQLSAELWATAASALADQPDSPVREMIWAAARALAYDPWSKHRGALLRLLARGCLGLSGYARLKRFVTPVIYGRVRR